MFSLIYIRIFKPLRYHREINCCRMGWIGFGFGFCPLRMNNPRSLLEISEMRIDRTGCKVCNGMSFEKMFFFLLFPIKSTITVCAVSFFCKLSWCVITVLTIGDKCEDNGYRDSLEVLCEQFWCEFLAKIWARSQNYTWNICSLRLLMDLNVTIERSNVFMGIEYMNF